MFQHHASMATLLLSVLAFAGCAEEEPGPQQHFPSDAAIQALIQSRVDEKRAVGIVVGVMEADGSTRIFAAGEAGPDAQPLGERSVFEIGSTTKVFTAILLADMVAKGEVAFDDPVAKFLPEGEVTMPTRGGKEITLLDLSTHRSALPRMPDNFTPADATNPYADYTVEQMYEFLSNHELRRDIGAEAEYSNLGAGLLGHVLARVNGNSYEELVSERILDPLGMSNTAITLSGGMSHWLVKGHDQLGNVVSNWDIATLEGAGALRSDVNDMLAFIAANTGPPESSLEEAMRAVMRCATASAEIWKLA
jgi:CubicO group peptidase (beta-lactamase class C family)